MPIDDGDGGEGQGEAPGVRQIRDLGPARCVCHAYTLACAHIPVHWNDIPVLWSAPASWGWGHPRLRLLE